MHTPEQSQRWFLSLWKCLMHQPSNRYLYKPRALRRGNYRVKQCDRLTAISLGVTVVKYTLVEFDGIPGHLPTPHGQIGKNIIVQNIIFKGVFLSKTWHMGPAPIRHFWHAINICDRNIPLKGYFHLRMLWHVTSICHKIVIIGSPTFGCPAYDKNEGAKVSWLILWNTGLLATWGAENWNTTLSILRIGGDRGCRTPMISKWWHRWAIFIIYYYGNTPFNILIWYFFNV